MDWLRVSDNKRFLVREDGQPFFWLGDTAWELFHRLTLEEADVYFKDRVDKGFTVIQTVALCEMLGIETPNVHGDFALFDEDPTKPNERYFTHIDAMIEKAADFGLYIALLPTWGCYVVGNRGLKLFDEERAYAYGAWIAKRYLEYPNLIWVNGGDRLLEIRGVDYCPVWRALAEGICSVDAGRHLMTFHPRGEHSSSEWFHNDGWLDFNMMQTGPRKDYPNYELIEKDYAMAPIKPCMDGEPGYEGATTDRLTAHDVRRYAYWALFAGAHGHTYGCLEIWQMYDPPKEPINGARIPWREALNLPGAIQMQYVRNLIESRPFMSRIPDQGLIASDVGILEDRVQATRGEDYAFVYVSSGRPVTVRMGRISGNKVTAWWFDPRSGEASSLGQFANAGTCTFTPPSRGDDQDWVLVLDDAQKSFSVPGH